MFPKLKFLGVALYIWSYISACIFSIFFSVLYSRKYRINLEKVFLLGTLIIPSIFITMYILATFDSAGGFNWVRAVVFMPVVIYFICSAIDLPFSRTLDFVAPSLLLSHGVAHFFCIFAGCCYGYPSTFGIWNERQQDYLFPVQLFESVTYILIFCYLLWYAKKKNYKVHGISYAQFLFLFGLTRTFWEFFRDNTEMRWQISTFQYYSFAAFLLGLIWLGIAFYLRKHPEFARKHELFFRDDVGELTRMKMFLRKRKRNK